MEKSGGTGNPAQKYKRDDSDTGNDGHKIRLFFTLKSNRGFIPTRSAGKYAYRFCEQVGKDLLPSLYNGGRQPRSRKPAFYFKVPAVGIQALAENLKILSKPDILIKHPSIRGEVRIDSWWVNAGGSNYFVADFLSRYSSD